MPPKRRARSPPDSQPLYADDTDLDSEQDTPKPHKLKKRVSEAYLGEGDSNTTDGGRVPLRSVNINDDAAEKRRRRKSTRIAVIEPVVGTSAEGGDQETGEGSRAGKQKQPLNSVAPPDVLNVPLDIMSSNFEEWMKMATDNKINATNSWNFALIDYFHDMSLLRNNDDNSINFQRASCTLDGCVKIWTSRVDSVGTETGKLLSNLANEGRDEDEGGNGSDDPDADSIQAKKKKAHKPTATLVKDALQLQSKKLELEFSVDPLFKKTCADFDEGGAHGLLMNHLSLGWGSEGALRIIFDASDGKGRVEVEEDLGDEPEEAVDLSYLRSQAISDINSLETKAISHSLEGFSFAKDAFSFDDSMYADDTRRDDDDDDDDNEPGADFGMDLDNTGAAPEDYFVGADAVGDDYAGDFGGGGYTGGSGGDEFGSGEGGSVGPPGDGEAGRGPIVPFDPRRVPNDRNLVMAMANTDESGGLDYFDQTFLKNWAGPEHWKLRKIIRRPEANPATAAEAKAAKGRAKKESFKIDFLAPQEKDLKAQQKELFAPVGKGASINLPKKKQEKKDEHMLPDDMHFSSRQLVTLFLKPKFFLRMRGKKARMDENGDEVDVDFWAQAAAGNTGEVNQEDENGAAIPFNTQFFHDDDDDGPGFDETYDAGGVDIDAGEQDLLAATQDQTRRVRPEFVKYAKRAKRVDVRKLKDNIWNGLDIVISKPKDEENESMDIDGSEQPPPTDPEESRQFKQVISGLQQSYPKDKMEEISTSFCFICLLHLANEQGLKLETGVESLLLEDNGLVEEDEEILPEKKVGNIWDIKIYRDPNATQAA